jgi:polyisoprenoid-binding protein YceI
VNEWFFLLEKGEMSTATLDRPVSTVYQIDRTHSEVRFRVRHLLSRVGGQFKDFTGEIVFDADRPEASSVNVRIDAASIDTGVPDRDAHLRSDDFFAVEKHPQLTFVSDRFVRTGAESFMLHGTLTIRGVSRQVELPVRYLGSARDPYKKDLVAFEASVRLNRKDFGLTWNAALETGGFLVGDDVEVTLNIEAARS